MDEEVSPWQLSIIGASTGDVTLSGDEQTLSLGISEICVAENQVSEDFSSSSSEDLSSLGFQSFGGEALSLLNERATVIAQDDQVLLAPTVLSDSGEITLSAFVNSSTDTGGGTDSLTIYLTDAEYVGYGVQYQGDGSTGVWALVQFTSSDSQSNLAQVAATDNHPTTGQTVTLNRSGDTLTVTVGGSDIALAYTVGEGIGDLSRYGVRSTALEVSDNNYLDDLTLTFTSSATCPALADAGEWDDAYSLHFIYQELLQQGELIARLSSHTNSGSGIAGIALRNGTAVTDKAIALIMDSSDNSIGLFTRDTDNAANTLTSTGQTGALPQWLKLVRNGDTITAYISTDGENWTQVDSVSISFDDIIKAGIAVAVTGSEAQILEYDNLSVVNELSGDITSDLELAAHQTYVVTGDVDVNGGATLTVNEGATILFESDFTFEVNGNLSTLGGIDTPVVFTSAQASPAKGDWYGIVVNNGGSLNLRHTTIEYTEYGVYADSGSSLSIDNSVFQYVDETGIYAYSATGSITNSFIQYADEAGIYLYGVTDITVNGNTITNNKYGFYILGYRRGVTTPTISGNAIINNSSYGIYLYGTRDSDYDPQPVITGNSIYNNSDYGIYTEAYDGGMVIVNATGNWWNTIDPEIIATDVYDYIDSTSSRPVVDYSGYLDSEGGTAAVSNGLLGSLTEDTTLVADTTYTLLSTLYIESGVTLKIEPGARIEIAGDFSFEVFGTIEAKGASDTPVIFTSNENMPIAGGWAGIVAQSGGTVNLDYVLIEYANYGLYAASGSTFSLSNSSLRYFSESGVYANNAAGSISNSTIQFADNSGVYLYGVDDVTISDSAITENNYGIYIRGYNDGATTPAINGNTITDNNSYGLYLYGVRDAVYDPQPVITGNSIHSNNSYGLYTDFYESGVITVDATGNWWNTTDPELIAGDIYDYTDTTRNRPIVDYSSYLDAEDGTADVSNGLFGYLTEDTTLLSGVTYTLLDTLYVQSGITLTIEPGARIEASGNFGLEVSGTLNAQGSANTPVVFTSSESTPSAGDWLGIVAQNGGVVELDYVILEYANYGLYAASGSTFSLSNSSLQYFSDSGIYAYSAIGSISNNSIQYADNAGVYLYGVTDVTVSENTITNNNNGFYIKGNNSGVTTPVISGNTIFDNSSYGLYLSGVRDADYDPQPVITGNNIYTNNSYDIYTESYESGVLTINATGNWWNTTDPELIEGQIYDYVDSTRSRPNVDYSGYLYSEIEISENANNLSGYLTEDITLVAGATYTLFGSLYVQSGVTLTIEPDARIEIAGDFSLEVFGTLDAQGTSDTPIIFSSAKSAPSAGDWVGIVAQSGGTVNLDYVTLEYADYGLYAASGSTFSLNNSTLQYFNESGVYADRASGSIDNSTIQYADNAGVYLYGVADVSVSDNTIADNKYGVFIEGYSSVVTAPTITGNTVTGNSDYGFYLYGVADANYDPQPVITGNSIYNNSRYNLYTDNYESGVLTVNATGNWWNTIDAKLIAEEVYDYGDDGSYRPLVDYSDYLDAEDGSSAISNGLLGYLAVDTTLLAGTTYTLLGTSYVPNGVTLTIEPGAHIEIAGDFSLEVFGTLDAQGSSDSPVVFTSDEGTPSAGDWAGIVAQTGGTVSLDYVTLEYAEYGLYAALGSTFSLSNSTLQYFNESGIYANSASGSIDNSTIQYADNAGVYLYGVADVSVSDNTITGNKYGVFIRGYSGIVTAPTITGNTVTGNTDYGFYLYGVVDTDYDPKPVITGNKIYSNSSHELYTESYESSLLNINARSNWWGATEWELIAAEIYDYTDDANNRPIVDYSRYLDDEGNVVANSNGLIGYLTEDTTLLRDTTYTLFGTSYVQSGVTLTIEPGARIKIAGDFSFEVSGTLNAQGSSDSLIVFTSGEGTPNAGDWAGIVVQSGGTVNLEYVVLEYADYGLYASSGSTFSLRNSTLQYFDASAVYAYNASGSITNNSIQYADVAGLYLYGVSDVTVSDNLITDNYYGFYIRGYSGVATTPTITGNIITGNSDSALYLKGVWDADYDPQPVITNNSIYSNNSYDLYTRDYENGVLTVNATGNWWNTTDSGEIGEEVYAYSDGIPDRPLVDYSGYLDAEGGSAAISNGLSGYLTEDTTLEAGTTYTIVNSVYVQSGVTLTIEPSARIEIAGDFSLEVYGTLDAQGTSDNPIVFTSDESEPSVGDWYGIVAQSGGTVNLDYVTIEYGDYGLYAASGSIFSLNNSTLQYADTAGVYLQGVANATVSGNTITDNKYGFYIQGYSGTATTPTITGNTITGNSSYGFYLDGVRDADYDPQPAITGNSIYNNSSYDLFTNNYEGGVTTVNATGNWWNTTDPGSIANEVYDYTDEAYDQPIVDYSGYLDTEGGSAAINDGLNGYLTEDTTLLADTTYTLLSTLYVQSDVTLTIEPGARIEVGGDFSIEVYGTLDVQGASDSPIVFTSNESKPSVGDWHGIVAQSDGTVNLNYVTIEYADYGLYAASGSTFSVSNSTLQYFDENGVYAYNASGSISNSTIQYADTAGVYLQGVANATVSGNTITDNKYGFYIQGYSGTATTPTITGNTVTGNSQYGFYLYGVSDADYDPQPVITGNSIYSNGSYDLYTNWYETGVVTVNATGNWWNTINSGVIAAEVYDYSDYTPDRPIVDFSGFLNNANGSPVYDYLLRFDIDSDTNLVAGSYSVVDDINVNNGVSLTLEAGAKLVFAAGYSLVVEGDLVVSGSSSLPVLFTSEAQYPVSGDWQGIVVTSGGSVNIDNAYIRYAETAVSATSPTAFSVTNSIITDFSESGISINNFTGGTIANNLIQNTDYTGIGMALDTASTAVTDNIVTGLNYGAYITGASSPSLAGNSFIDNNYGIYLNGSGSDSTNPTPIITGNNLYGNTSGSLYLNNYGSSSALVLNITGNWWGSAAPEWGGDIIGVDSPEAVVDYSAALSAETRVITSDLNGDYEYFSPNSDGIKDSLAITATLSSASNWDLEISNESGAVVNVFSGTGADINIDWDGTDSGSTVLNDGRYYLFLKVTDVENTSYRAGAMWVELDNTAPIALMNNINDGDTLSTGVTTLEIEGSAIDNFFVDYSVDYQLSGDIDNWVSLKYSTSGVSESTLAEWAVNSADGTVEAPASGNYQIRLVTTDRAGNITTITRTVTLDLLSITNVSRNQTTVNPVADESLVISFDLSASATVTLDIKDEQTEELVRSMVETFDSAGSYSLSWDGKDDEGNYVPEEAYTYFLTAVSGSVEGVYGIEDGGSAVDVLLGTMDTTMNAVQNDFMKTEVTPTENVRVYMEVTPDGGDTHIVYDNVPMEAGTHYMTWDGRTADGVLTTGSFYTYVPEPEILPTNVVIIDGIKPSISGTLDAPNIEVKSDPYLMYHSYDQISKVAYLLDQDSYVTFKLLPPDIGDPTDAGAITLIDNQLQVANDSDGAIATHEVEWKGYDESDGNAIMVSDEGVFSFWIQAISATTGASTTYYGALQLYQ
ncbi:right-handed parallel beta-helix repeat-containing protein [Microbulbifer sp. ZKSA006]|uniref:right-handed parallel beta-helix repeat-containing protein n=1 Tax=Microbulbifer sp. ZKSA006 TaxID=3243390 RepID=UPI00403A383B